MSRGVKDTLPSQVGKPLRVQLQYKSFQAPAYEEQAPTVVGRLWAYDAQLEMLVLETGNTSALPPPMRRVASSAAHGSSAAQARGPSVAPGPLSGFKLINTAGVANFDVLSEPEYASARSAAGSGATFALGGALSSVPPVAPAALEARESASRRRSLEKAERTGSKDVGEMGQAVFDALSKTLPCRWHGPHIIVLDEVVISGPAYDKSSTYVPSLRQDQLERLLRGERLDASEAPVERAHAKAQIWQRVTKVLEGERGKIAS